MNEEEVLIIITKKGIQFMGPPVGIGLLLDTGQALVDIARGQMVSIPGQEEENEVVEGDSALLY